MQYVIASNIYTFPLIFERYLNANLYLQQVERFFLIAARNRLAAKQNIKKFTDESTTINR